MTERKNITVTESDDGKLINVFIPMQFGRKGGRKKVIIPEGSHLNLNRDSEQDATLFKALVKAHRWQSMLDDGTVANKTELAKLEGIASIGYVSQIIRLVNLAPDIQEAIVNGTHPRDLTLADLIKVKVLPRLWREQKALLGFIT